MKKEQDKIIHFTIDSLEGVSVTHGYHIVNKFPVHFHSSYNIGITEYGEREFFYRGQTYVFQKDDIFFIQPFEPHSCKAFGNLGHSYKILSFNSNQLLYFPDFTLKNEPLLKLLKAFHTLAEYEKSSPELVDLFQQIMQSLKALSLDAHNQKSAFALSNISKAKTFIDKNCLQELSLKQMANQAFMSEYHFNRNFHKCFGLSPYAYYLVCKIKKAQKLLVQHDSVVDATFESGFFDQSHFTRLFKRHVGVTPGRFLRDNKN